MLGNPGKLKMAAQKLTQEIKMEQLPELMEQNISNWDKIVAFTPFMDPTHAFSCSTPKPVTPVSPFPSPFFLPPFRVFSLADSLNLFLV